MAEWESYGYNSFIVCRDCIYNCLGYFDNARLDPPFEGRPLCTLIKEEINESDYGFAEHPLAKLIKGLPFGPNTEQMLGDSDIMSYYLFFHDDPIEYVHYERQPYHAFIKVTAAGMKRRWEQRERDVKAADELFKHDSLCNDVVGIIKSFLANPK